MAEVASAYVTLIPHFKDLSGYIEGALGSPKATSSAAAAGSKAASSFASSFAGGAVMGAVSSVVSSAMGAISSSLGSAIARVDTMNNFPRVMESLGFSADTAQGSIDRMASRIDGLPTSLNALTSVAQRLTATTGDLDYATTLSIALNDALLAGSASTVDVERALVQYTQALAKGKPELEDWRTLQEVMPGQLNAIAKAMMGADASSNDLYQAMKDGVFTMEDFNAALITLDNEGMEGMASFEQQARSSTKGIGTAMTNVGNRVSKALGSVIEAIGPDAIAGAIDRFSSGIVVAGNRVASFVSSVKGSLSSLVGKVKQTGEYAALSEAVGRLREAFAWLKPDIDGAVTSLIESDGVFGAVRGAVGALASGIDKAASYMNLFKSKAEECGAFEALSSALGVLGKLADEARGVFSQFVDGLTRGSDPLASASGLVSGAAQGLRDFAVAAQRGFAHARLFLDRLADSGAVGRLGESLGGLVGSVGDFVGAIAGSLGEILGWNDGVGGTSAAADLAVWALDGLSGKMDTLSAVVQAAAPLVQSLFETAMPAVKAAVESAMPAVQAAFETALPLVQQAVETAIPVVQSLFETAMGVVGSVVEAAVPVAQALFESALPAMQAVVETALPVVQSLFETALPLVQQAVETAIPVAQGFFESALPAMRSAVETAMPVIQSAVETAMPLVQAAVETVLPLIQGFFETYWPQMRETVESVMGAIQLAVDTVMPIVQGVFEAAWPTVQAVVVSVFGIIQSVVSTGMDFINTVISVITSVIQGDWEGAWDAIKTFLSNAWENIKSAVSDAIGNVWETISDKVESIKSFWSEAWESVKSKLSEAWENIKSSVSEGVSNVVQFFTDLPGNILGALGDLGSLLWDAGKSIIDGLWNGLKSTWDGVVGWFSDITGQIAQMKGPPAYDAVMLVKNGQLIMRGLNRGLESGWGETRGLLRGYTEEMARAGEAMAVSASFDARGPVARSSRASAARGPVSAGVVIQNMNINARDLRDVKTVEQFSARVLGRELAVL